MRFTLAEQAVSETWTERRPPRPYGGDGGDSEKRAGLALSLSTAEGQGIALTAALAWTGVAVWGGGLAWLMVSDFVARRARHQAASRDRRDGPDVRVRASKDAS